jgi:flagellar protein FliL
LAEEEEEGQEEQEEKPKGPPPKPASLLRYLPIVLVVLLLQAGGAYFYINKYLFPGEGPTAVQDEAGRPRVMPEGDEPEASVDLGSVDANPRGTGARLLVRTSVTLAVAPSDAAGEIESDQNKDRIRDAVLWELGNATHEELSSPEGRDIVKDRMKNRVNDYLYEGQVVAIYFGDFILQAMPGYGR